MQQNETSHILCSLSDFLVHPLCAFLLKSICFHFISARDTNRFIIPSLDLRSVSFGFPIISFWFKERKQYNHVQVLRSGSREQQETSRESRYPSFVAGSSSNTSHLSTANSSSGLSTQRISDQPQTSHGQVSPSEAAGIIARLKDKSVGELQKLLNYEDAYTEFLHSFDQVKIQNDVGDELRNETTQLARKNLEKEPWVLELRNLCRIIRTTKLAAAQEKLNKLERNKDGNLRFTSILLLLRRMQDAMNSMDEESEVLHRRLLDEEIDLKTFVQKYKKLRTIYHQRSLLHFAAKMSAG